MLPQKSLCTLIINAIFVRVILNFPRLVVENSGSAAWIQVLYNTAAALLIFSIIMRLSNKKRNMIDMINIRWLKIAVGLAVSALLFINLIPVVRIFPEEVKVAMLQETDKRIIILILIAVSFMGAHLGIEAIARAARLFVPVIAAIFIASVLLLIPKYSMDNLYPIFGLGIKNIFGSGFHTISLFSDLIVLDILIPYTENLVSVRQSGKVIILVSGTAAAIAIFVYCLTVAYPLSKEFVIPLYNMARLIDISSFFSRFEAFYEFVWTIMVLLYISMYIYIISYVIEITFFLKNNRLTVLSVSAAVLLLALLPDTDNLFDSMWKYSYIAIIGLIIIFGREWKRKRI